MKQAIIVIPLYKAVPNKEEHISFIQNIGVLASHPFSIVTHNELDISYYINELESEGINYRIDFFDKYFFGDVETYSRLLMSEHFYQRYANYQYILITQLDVYVFSDNLMLWCEKGYDYIGAPWFDKFKSNHREAKLAVVGNGGFSLRKVASYLQVFKEVETKNKNISVFNYWNQFLFMEHYRPFLLLWKQSKGINNNLKYYLDSGTQEDVVWSLIVSDVYKWFKVAPIKEALQFSFECDPSYLYELNNNQLPFGCHAWHKNQYEEFWTKYIK